MAKRTTSSPQKGKKKEKNIFKQFYDVFVFTRKEYPYTPWILLGVFIVVVAVCTGIGVAVSRANRFAWIGWFILGLILAVATCFWVLSRLANRVAYRSIKGKPAAAYAILQGLNSRGYKFLDEPVWVDSKSRSMVWEGVGRPGIFLVAEGNPARLRPTMNNLEASLRRLAPGSSLPIFRIYTGEGKGQVPIEKLDKEIRHHKRVLSRREVIALEERLGTLQGKRVARPHSVDPAMMKMSPRTIRRHS